MRKEDRGNLLGGWVPQQRDEDKPKRQKPVAAPPVIGSLAPAPPGAGLVLLASFVRDPISGAAGAAMLRATAALDSSAGYQLPGAKCMTGGWIFDVTVRISGGTSGATHWQVEVYVNGVATGIIKRQAATTITDQSTVARYSVRPDDVITVVDTRSGALNAAEGFADVWGRLEGLPGAAGV